MSGNTTLATSNEAAITVSEAALAISVSSNSSYYNYYNSATQTFSLLGATATATLSGTGLPTNLGTYDTITWSSSNDSIVAISGNADNRSKTVTLTAGVPGTATISATYRPNNQGVGTTATFEIKVSYNYDLQPVLTVTSGVSHCLNDPDGVNSRSVVSYITYYGGNSLGNYPYVVFEDITSTVGYLDASKTVSYYLNANAIPGGWGSSAGLLSDVYFTPTNTGTSGFRFNVYSGNTKTASGFLTVTVSGVASYGDIPYTAAIGQDVYFNLSDFSDFYYSKTHGTLSYVTFTLPSTSVGRLYSNNASLASGNYCYASPRNNQTDLSGVYFTPAGATATRAGSVSISFTAYGTNGAARAGTVVITYLSGTAKDITYNSFSSTIPLQASDFTDAYRQVVGTAAPSGMTIQFQDVPANGTLTYTDSSRSGSSAVTLRSGNVQSYRFYARTTGSNQLGDVTYTASGSRSDTISYIAYNGTTPQFTGKVVFNPTTASTTMSVTLLSSNGAPITFSYNAFATANALVMATCTSIRIVGLPNSGALSYYGVAVSAGGTDILPSALGSLVYRPNAGFNGTDKVTFICKDASGAVVGSGQVNLIVSGNTNSSSGASNVDQFKDVSATAWYRSDLSKLVSQGIIKGRGDGKFDPTANLKYGEALKIFMLAAGYSAQPEPSGKNWAVNYKDLAVRNNWISSDVDLNAEISRNAMAELAAKALGVSASTAPSPWSDSGANGYAIALYYTTPQILKGNDDGTFKGNTTLRRQEICAIASRVLDYRANVLSSQAPGWIGG